MSQSEIRSSIPTTQGPNEFLVMDSDTSISECRVVLVRGQERRECRLRWGRRGHRYWVALGVPDGYLEAADRDLFQRLAPGRRGPSGCRRCGVAPGLRLQNGCRAVSHGRSGGLASLITPGWRGSVARTAPWRV